MLTAVSHVPPAGHGPTDPVDGPLNLWTTRQPGTYLLLIQLAAPVLLEVGRLGRVQLPAGWYIYIGSALGGLGARIRRHARSEKRPHWHIDRLLAVGRLVSVVARVGPERVECQMAAQIAALPAATLPVSRFGASDCRCPAHLVHVAARPDLTLDTDWKIAPLIPPV